MTTPKVAPCRNPCLAATCCGSRSICRYLAVNALCPLKAITVRMLISACTGDTGDQAVTTSTLENLWLQSCHQSMKKVSAPTCSKCYQMNNVTPVMSATQVDEQFSRFYFKAIVTAHVYCQSRTNDNRNQKQAGFSIAAPAG